MISQLKLIGWILRGKTITRSIMNAKLAEVPPLEGITLDLGGGGSPTYKEVLKINGTFINMDAMAEANPTVVGNLESTFPFVTNYADNAILLNTLEHIYDYQHVANEMFRVTKENGQIILFIPFMFPVHTHQTENFFIDDYFRYSKSALKNILTKAGFKEVTIEPCGGLLLVLGELLSFALRLKILTVPLSILFVLLNPIHSSLRKNTASTSFPLAYFVKAIK